MSNTKYVVYIQPSRDMSPTSRNQRLALIKQYIDSVDQGLLVTYEQHGPGKNHFLEGWPAPVGGIAEGETLHYGPSLLGSHKARDVAGSQWPPSSYCDSETLVSGTFGSGRQATPVELTAVGTQFPHAHGHNEQHYRPNYIYPDTLSFPNTTPNPAVFPKEAAGYKEKNRPRGDRKHRR